ncbi:MAG: hypothetical protein ABFC24_12505 [Methanoregulaceae archaeon]
MPTLPVSWRPRPQHASPIIGTSGFSIVWDHVPIWRELNHYCTWQIAYSNIGFIHGNPCIVLKKKYEIFQDIFEIPNNRTGFLERELHIITSGNEERHQTGLIKVYPGMMARTLIIKAKTKTIGNPGTRFRGRVNFSTRCRISRKPRGDTAEHSSSARSVPDLEQESFG